MRMRLLGHVLDYMIIDLVTTELQILTLIQLTNGNKYIKI